MADDTASRTAQVRASLDDPAAPVIHVSGELDIAAVDRIRAEIDTYLVGEPKLVVFDLTDLQFMDSSGIALLVLVANRCGAVEVRNPSRIVRRVLEATGMAELFGLDG